MKKQVKFLLVLIVVLLMVTIVSCKKGSQEQVLPSEGKVMDNNDSENAYSKRIKFSASSINLPEQVSFMDDAVYKAFDDKFNFEYDLFNITWETWSERDRLWIISGDMPDMLFWDFNLKDYNSFSNQGLIKALPDDLETKYPNLAKEMDKTGIANYLKNKNEDNKLYMIPNVIYLNPPTKTTDIIIDPKVVYYRKDWAKTVGIEVGDKITIEELAKLATAFIEQDPGKNGEGKTIGISAPPSNIDSLFVRSFNTYYDTFHKAASNSYIWGGTEDSTLQGIKELKKYYESGIIDSDYYAYKGKEHYEKFDNGIAGIFFDGASAANVNERLKAFGTANPDLNASDAIGLVTVVGPDGKYHGAPDILNYWSGLLFNPDISDEKMDRILSILDYTCTEEGQRLINCGIEGKDYVLKDGNLEITRDKDKNGNFLPIADLYPSADFFSTKGVLPDDWSARDPSLPSEAREEAIKMFQVKELNMDLVEPNYEITLFDGEKKLSFPLRIDDIITNMVLSDGNLDEEWNSFITENKSKIDEVVDEINSKI